MKVLVTAGPTREFIDDVRFLSNPSSGKMGFEVAAACAGAGHEVVLVSGPVALEPPEGVGLVPVVSAKEMERECLARFPSCDAVVMTAAVSDYTPAERIEGKMKKKAQTLSLELVPTTDILAEMGRQKKKQVLVGFALEVEDARGNAEGKLAAKNLDYIVLNSPATFESDSITCSVIDSSGKITPHGAISKRALAREIVKLIESGHRETS